MRRRNERSDEGKRVWKIWRRLGILIILAALTGLLCLVFGCVFREWNSLPRAMTGDGWEQNRDEDDISVSPREFAEICTELECFLEERGITETWQWKREEAVWERIERVMACDGRELSGDDAFLYQELVYVGELRGRERELPDYYNYLSETEGVLNELWMYAATEQGSYGGSEALAAWVTEASRALLRQQEVGRLYPASQLGDAITQCRQLLEEELPGSDIRLREAVEKLLSCLEELEGTEEITGLCQLPMGGAYYDVLLEWETGSGLTAKEMYDSLSELREALSMELSDMEGQDAGSRLQNADAGQLLALLEENTRLQFGYTGEESYELREMPEALGGRTYVGFYKKDLASDSHVVYIEQSSIHQNAYEKYEILAHEGFPGHLFFQICQQQRPYAGLRCCLSGKGCREGWAVYSEFLAAQWLEEDREGYRAFLIRKLLDEVILSQMDIGIHSFGWDQSRLTDYCREVYGEIRPEGVTAVGVKLSGQPAMYLSYAVGYMKVCELERAYMEIGHSREEFVEWFLRYGQTAFTMIEEYAKTPGSGCP